MQKFIQQAITTVVLVLYFWLGSLYLWPFIQSAQTIEDVRNIGLVVVGMIGLPLALWRAVVNDKQARISETGQNIDRFQKAVTMLSDDSGSIREAGIRQLALVATIDKKNHYRLVQDTLCGYIRERSPAIDKETPHNPLNSLQMPKDCTLAFETFVALRNLEPPKMIRKTKQFFRILLDKLRPTFLPNQFDLSNSNLSYATFLRANLSGVNFANCTMVEVSFYGCDVNKSNFYNAVLESAILTDCDLSNVSFQNANLRFVDFRKANLTRAALYGARLNDANVLGANFKDAFLEPDPNDIHNRTMGLTFSQMREATNVDPTILQFLKDAKS